MRCPAGANAALWEKYDALLTERRARWDARRSIQDDRAFVERAADALLEDGDMAEFVRRYPYLLIELVCTVVDKKRQSLPFFLNPVQKMFLDTFTRRRERGGTFFILKGRQQGFTTLITALQLVSTIVCRNFCGVTIAHRADAARSIFAEKGRRMYEALPASLRPTERYHNAGELSFSRLGSAWRVATASEDVFRGSTLDMVHLSEAAFYEKPLSLLQASLGETLSENGVIIVETTANGWGDAKRLWDSGSAVNLFYPWWLTPEYTREEPLPADLLARDGWLRERVKLLEEKGLTKGQIGWYCHKYGQYLDKRLIRQEYPCMPEEAFLQSGDCYFDVETTQAQLANRENKPPLRRGYFVYRRVGTPIYEPDGTLFDTQWQLADVAFRESENGMISIWEEPKTRKNGAGVITARAPYSVGGDTAGAGIDYFTAVVLCNVDGHTAATLRCQRMDEDEYAEQILCLAQYYHGAAVGIEINYSGHPVRVLEQKYRYPALYRRTGGEGSTCGEGVAGFVTDKATRPVILAELKERMRNPALENDPEILREMCAFVRGSDGRPAAAPGSHDDMVMAAAIANHVRLHAPPGWEKTEEPGAARPSGGNEGYMQW